MFTKVLLALDGSPEATAAIPYARAVLEPGGSLDIVHVRELIVGRGGRQTLHPDEGAVEDTVQRAVAELTAEGVHATLHLTTSAGATAAHAIADAARRLESDVIVMGTRGQSQVVGLLLGSVTQRLLHIAPCPVFAVPPGAVLTPLVADAAAAHA
jgi:nucleotide-binding universal stress UspA family protein